MVSEGLSRAKVSDGRIRIVSRDPDPLMLFALEGSGSRDYPYPIIRNLSRDFQVKVITRYAQRM